MESAIYRGKVWHKRVQPTQHAFSYNINQFFIKLSELQQLHEQLPYFSVNRRNWVEFRRSDYLGDSSLPLQDAVLSRMNELSSEVLQGEVYLLGQLRMLGMYFSPVNFYYLKEANGDFTHILAEVSNTPWNERHHYLVRIDQPKATEKAFHVSPFNPLDMEYHWQISQPHELLNLTMHCVKQSRHFSAGINLRKNALNPSTLRSVLLHTPSSALSTVVGIYWQALKLWLKRTPIYDHPAKQQEN